MRLAAPPSIYPVTRFRTCREPGTPAAYRRQILPQFLNASIGADPPKTNPGRGRGVGIAESRFVARHGDWCGADMAIATQKETNAEVTPDYSVTSGVFFQTSSRESAVYSRQSNLAKVDAAKDGT